MNVMSEADADLDGVDEGLEGGPEYFECDFCGEMAQHVRRVALDRDYDRLQKPHPVQFACDRCSAEKERRRLDPADS